VIEPNDLVFRTALRVRNCDEIFLSNYEELSNVFDMAPEGKNSILFLNIEQILGYVMDARLPLNEQCRRPITTG